MKKEGPRLFGLALVGHCLLFASDLVGVAEVVILHELELVVELEYVRGSRRDVELRDLAVADALEVLHDAAQAIAVGSHDDAVHLLELREDRALPVRHHTLDGVLQALRCREIVLRHEGVARIRQCAADAVGGNSWGATSKLRRHCSTCSSPYLAAVSALFRPWSIP